MKEYVEAGACLLDAERPGWHRRIDVERLDMSNSCDCIGGQEEGRYDLFLKAMGISAGSKLGFHLSKERSTGNCHRDWKYLRQLWIEQIECRLLRDELEASADIGVKAEEELVVA